MTDDGLRAFVAALFRAAGWPHGGDIDGFDFQDLAIAHGILTPQERTEPCAENCHCVEYGAADDPSWTCYRKPQWLIDAAAALVPHGDAT